MLIRSKKSKDPDTDTETATDELQSYGVEKLWSHLAHKD